MNSAADSDGWRLFTDTFFALLVPRASGASPSTRHMGEVGEDMARPSGTMRSTHRTAIAWLIRRHVLSMTVFKTLTQK